jgi:hypothetical protein
MDMLPLQSQQQQPRLTVAVAALAAAALVTLAPGSARAGGDDAQGGVVIDVNGAKRGLYPIAAPTAPEGDQLARDIAQVESSDMSLAGVFKVVDPASFLADLKSEGLPRSGRTSGPTA